MTVIQDNNGEVIFSTHRYCIIYKGYAITYLIGERVCVYSLSDIPLDNVTVDTVDEAKEKVDILAARDIMSERDE